MLLKSLFALWTFVVASNAAAIEPDEGRVLTVKRIYHTIIDKSPFLVDRTTTIVWTQSPSISATTDAAVETST
ncbi:hypothetical protein Hypma_004467 [Hypsizygus marmoreus]|uniref:Uncharacterized protein n=1 Tax=Hypsizygus marmoreus TaxID=39966 RepID=A0A369K1I1_HYPMA|nr:hypothetical protein Hypma_004467 [Hypsizygus marmoreus]